jgi:flagellar transcriptional activator FlhC
MAKVLSGGKRASSGPLPSPNYFISSMASLSEASLFAAIYRSVGGKKVFETIDTDALIKAFDMYMEMRSIYFKSEKEPLDINKCWVIARDLRSNMAWLHKCAEDNCYYLLVEGQRLPSCCPWCTDKKKERPARTNAVESARLNS